MFHDIASQLFARTKKTSPAEIFHELVLLRSSSNDNESVEHARELAKNGNPMPLIAMQWPELVITDEETAAMFDGTIGDPLDPCLRIDTWQRGIIFAAFDVTVGEIPVKGCTGAGKGFTGGLLINLLFDVFNPARINITSQTFVHAQRNLFGEFSLWHQKMEFPTFGNLLSTQLSDSERHYVTVLNPSQHGGGEAFSGMHTSDGPTIYFFDEASAISEVSYENALKNAAKIFAFSNPRVTEGWFRDMYRPLQGEGTKEERYERENLSGYCPGRLGRRYCVTVPGLDCTNVKHRRLKKPVSPVTGITIDDVHYPAGTLITPIHYEKVKAIVPGQIDLQQYESIIHTSKEPWQVECFALARFPTENPTRQAILYSWLQYHIKAWNSTIPVTAFGLDVARSKSGDSTCLVAGGVKGVRGVHDWVDDSHTRHIQKILRIAKVDYGVDLRDGQYPVCIDMGGGYGAAVFDRMQQLGVWVIPFMPSGRPIVYPGLYTNQRSEWYMLLGRRLDPSDNWIGYPWALPNDEKLLEDVSAPIKHLTRDGTCWGLEPKDDIARRLGRSPDKGDAVVCLWRAVFDKHNLIDKMTEGVNDPIISAEYAEQSTNESKEEEFIIPPPMCVQDEGDTLNDLFESLGEYTEKPVNPLERYFGD